MATIGNIIGLFGVLLIIGAIIMLVRNKRVATRTSNWMVMSGFAVLLVGLIIAAIAES